MSQLGRALGGTWGALLEALGSLTALLMAVMTLVVVYDVVTRHFFRRPSNWAVDFTEYGLLYITFLGAAWALRHGAHVRVEIVVSQFGPRLQLFASILVALIAAGVVAILFWLGVDATWEAYVKGQAMLKSWRVPRWALMLPIAVGSLLLMIEFLRQAWGSFQALRQGRRPEAPLAIEVEEEALL